MNNKTPVLLVVLCYYEDIIYIFEHNKFHFFISEQYAHIFDWNLGSLHFHMTIVMRKVIAILCLATLVASASGFALPSAKISSNHATASALHMSSPFDAFTKIFAGLKPPQPAAVVIEVKPVLPDVVIAPDYKLAVIFLVAGMILDFIPYIQLLPGPFITLLGILFLVQTSRVRFVFDQDAFELKSGGDSLASSGENVVVGGANRWTYDSFGNYEFFPKGWVDQPQGPILVYFKETQTPSDKWSQGPGKLANADNAIANGARPGQVHFFPALCNTKQLRDEFEKRGCAKLDNTKKL